MMKKQVELDQSRKMWKQQHGDMKKKMKKILLKKDMKKKNILNIIQYIEQKYMKKMEKLLLVVKRRNIMIIGLLPRLN